MPVRYQTGTLRIDGHGGGGFARQRDQHQPRCWLRCVATPVGGISTGLGASVGQSNAVSGAASIGNGAASSGAFSNNIGVGVGGGFTNVLP